MDHLLILGDENRSVWISLFHRKSLTCCCKPVRFTRLTTNLPKPATHVMPPEMKSPRNSAVGTTRLASCHFALCSFPQQPANHGDVPTRSHTWMIASLALNPKLNLHVLLASREGGVTKTIRINLDQSTTQRPKTNKKTGECPHQNRQTTWADSNDTHHHGFTTGILLSFDNPR